MILAAGLGTRLRPLTDVRPKPLLPLVLQPMLDRILDQLCQQEVQDVAINLHHRASQLEQWLGNGDRWGLRLQLSHEPEILGTAGGIKRLEVFLRDAPFLVINADVLVDLDFRAVWHWHCQRGALVTMVVQPDLAAKQYGPVLVDTTDRVRQIDGRPHAQTHVSEQETIFTGIQVVSPELLERIPSGRFSSTTTDVYPAVMATSGAVYGYRHAGYWLDIGVPERYLQAHWDILDGLLGDRWLDRLPSGTDLILEEHVSKPGESEVTIIPPVVLGEGVELVSGACVGPYAVLGARCQVGAGAVVRESVIWEDVHIAAEARIHRSILGAGVCVREASMLHNVVRTV
jgi:NDP-sugar pyrophosphorylase family protein